MEMKDITWFRVVDESWLNELCESISGSHAISHTMSLMNSKYTINKNILILLFNIP